MTTFIETALRFDLSQSSGLVITLATALISFIAGQTWSIAKFFYRKRMLRKALEREIGDLQPWINRNIITLECMLQLAVVDELANHCPVTIPIQVHADHFPEINLNLSRSARISINAIYNNVHRINKDIEKMMDMVPTIGHDPQKMHQFRLLIDTVYRNSKHALLLIHLHGQGMDKRDLLGEPDETSSLVKQMNEENESRLLQLAAEAKKNGAMWVRKKYSDGAATADDVVPTPPPIAGKFYYDLTGTKLKCLSVSDDMVTWLQLESQIGVLTVDAIARRPLSSVRHVYPITDKDEIARLERRCDHLNWRRTQASG